MKPQTNGKSYGQSWSFKKKRRGGFKDKRTKKPVLRKKDIVDEEIAKLQEKIDQKIDASKVELFTDFPLSENTLKGLKKAKYSKPTAIQRQAIAAALQGKDVLGASKTGSGKTLAFLIPVLEVLFKTKASSAFGMVALIITPTRELAFQIFQVLQKICTFHDFTCNLIIGGKYMSYEIRQMNNTNIVICTPGRLLHHFNKTCQFNADDLKILVLDEADRIMDSKFAEDMNNIISYLPTDRQTLLFSATQTKKVKDLVRLGLKDPTYVSTDEHAEHSTPSGLKQSYMVCEPHDKLSLLVSFLREFQHTKTMVFVQTCKQVRYVHAVLRRELEGRAILHLHGGMNQLRRIEIYQQFSQKQHVVLVTTDVSCRGLDFPNVSWVVQLDSPPDVETYIHRVGRTARFEKKGQALLVLTPSEKDRMLDQLKAKKIPILKINGVDPRKFRDVTSRLASACAEDQELKAMAERAVWNYVYSVSQFKHFDPETIDLEKFSQSFGLFKAPRFRFLERKIEKMQEKSKTKKGKVEDDDSDDSENGSEQKNSSERKSVVKKKSRVGKDSESDESESDDDSDSGESDSKDSDSDDDSGDDLFTVKKTDGPVPGPEETILQEDEESEAETSSKKTAKSKVQVAKRLLKKGIVPNLKIKFDDEGNVVHDAHKRQREEEEDEDDDGGINITSASKRLRKEDKEVDRLLERERVRQKHREERIKKKEKKRAEKQQRRAEDGEEDEMEAVLSGVDEDDDPLQYIPDPDKLAARRDEDSDDEEEEQSDDDDENENGSDDDGSDDDEEEEEEEESSEDDDNNQSALENAALQLLQNRRKR